MKNVNDAFDNEMIDAQIQFFKECYKCYSILFPIGDVFAITYMSFNLFVNQINIIDQNLSPNDINLKWTATTQSMIKKDNARNPERGMVRFQFIEVLTRLAEQKFYFSNLCSTYYEAVEKLYQENLKDELNRCCSQNWRQDRFWNEDCESVILKYKIQIEQIFNTLIKRRQYNKTQKNYLIVDDLLEMNKLLEQNQLSERDIQESIIQSIMLQIDELNYDRHQQMQLVEFYEFIARIADKYFPQYVRNIQSDTLYTIESQKDMPFYYKLEQFIILLKQKILENNYDQRYSQPRQPILQPRKSKLGLMLKEHQKQIQDLSQKIQLS